MSQRRLEKSYQLNNDAHYHNYKSWFTWDPMLMLLVPELKSLRCKLTKVQEREAHSFSQCLTVLSVAVWTSGPKDLREWGHLPTVELTLKSMAHRWSKCPVRSSVPCTQAGKPAQEIKMPHTRSASLHIDINRETKEKLLTSKSLKYPQMFQNKIPYFKISHESKKKKYFWQSKN